MAKSGGGTRSGSANNPRGVASSTQPQAGSINNAPRNITEADERQAAQSGLSDYEKEYQDILNKTIGWPTRERQLLLGKLRQKYNR